MQSAKILSTYSRNGVLPLSVLKARNYPLLRYVLSNYTQVSCSLVEQGVEILNDLITRRELGKIKLYLQYHYGSLVNLSDVRQNHRTVYNYLSNLGKPREVVERMGFDVIYRSHSANLESELRELGKDGVIHAPLPQVLYNKVYYRAKKVGMDIKQYLKSLGFEYKEV